MSRKIEVIDTGIDIIRIEISKNYCVEYFFDMNKQEFLEWTKQVQKQLKKKPKRSNTKTCNNCIHWTPNNDRKAGICNSQHFEYTGQGGETPTMGLSYSDGEGYSANFETGPEFGCIHFEKR